MKHGTSARRCVSDHKHSTGNRVEIAGMEISQEAEKIMRALGCGAYLVEILGSVKERAKDT